MLKDFKAFLIKGNVLDLAVAVLIGAAFGKVVTSFVGDILTPLLSLGMGKIDFSNLFFALNGEHYASLEEAKKAGAATINFGLFANNVIDFVIVGFAIFLIVRLAQRLRREPPAPEAESKLCVFCKTSIHKDATRCSACTSQIA